MKKSISLHILFFAILFCKVQPICGNPQDNSKYKIKNFEGEEVWIITNGEKKPASIGMALNVDDSVSLATQEDYLCIVSSNRNTYGTPPHGDNATFSIEEIISYNNSIDNRDNLWIKALRELLTNVFGVDITQHTEVTTINMSGKDKGEHDVLFPAIFVRQQFALYDTLKSLCPSVPLDFTVCWVQKGSDICTDSVLINKIYRPQIHISHSIPDSACILMRISYSDSDETEMVTIHNNVVCENLEYVGHRISSISKIELWVVSGVTDVNVDSLSAFLRSPHFEDVIIDDIFLNTFKSIEYYAK